MKKLLISLCLVCFSAMLPAQDLQKLQAEIESLKARVTMLEQKLAGSVDTTSIVKTTSTESKRCIATTTAGYQCSRNADPGSDYCWQHKKIYEPTTSSSVSTSTSSSTKSSSTTSSGRVIQTGPRGGQYYINSSGKKVYVKKK